MWRHGATPFLDSTIVLAPNPEWVKTLPGGKLPDRTDFMTYDRDLAGRVKVWNAATQASQQLAEEFSGWLHKPDASVTMLGVKGIFSKRSLPGVCRASCRG